MVQGTSAGFRLTRVTTYDRSDLAPATFLSLSRLSKDLAIK